MMAKVLPTFSRTLSPSSPTRAADNVFRVSAKHSANLSKAAQLAKERQLTDLERQGLIQAFEFTHELAWNTMKDFLEHSGATGIYGSKDATREAFSKGLIANGPEWMAMIQARNRSSHTYNENTAREVADAILASFVEEFARSLVRLTQLEQAAP